jgi:prevent-host-death family protein
MREINASDAELNLPEILNEVEHGETVVITRNGRPIAWIVPEPRRRQHEVDEAIERIRTLGRRTGRITTEELLSSR